MQRYSGGYDVGVLFEGGPAGWRQVVGAARDLVEPVVDVIAENGAGLGDIGGVANVRGFRGAGGQDLGAGEGVLTVGGDAGALVGAAEVVIAGAADELTEQAGAQFWAFAGLIRGGVGVNCYLCVADRQQANTEHAADAGGVRGLGVPVGASSAAWGDGDGDVDEVDEGEPAEGLVEDGEAEGQFQFDGDHGVAVDADDVAFADFGTDRVAEGFEVGFDRAVQVAFTRWRCGFSRRCLG
jgi:hypothetical protein